jgi:hypothetical protein
MSERKAPDLVSRATLARVFGGGTRRRVGIAVALCGVIGMTLVAGAVGGPPAAVATNSPANASECQLANGIKHVIELGFDNVHYYRDNPNVPSDMEMMPNLLNFIEQNGTLLSNNHTPLIAHTADDLLTTFTGLYGDRQGMPVSNAYQAYNTDGTTDPADSFTYWTDPVDDTASTPNSGHDTNPSLVYSASPPATTTPAAAPNTETPAPWVPFTRAGCNVGEVATVDQELETTTDITKVFGAGSPEAQQLAADTDPYKDPETADYIGLAIHCAKASTLCANAEAVKYGQTSPSHTAAPDLLPDEPGGYSGYQALFGAKYIDPVLGAGTPNVTKNGYQITNSKGNIVDLDGNEIDGEYLTAYPGFPGYGDINAPQALAYTADMLESGVQVVDLYMSDIHGNDDIPSLTGSGEPCYKAPDALASGSACYIAQAQYYNQAFGVFFQRLAADGITPANTLFIFSNDEGDHEAGANVSRAVQPTPAGCDGATVSGNTVTPDVLCTYPAGTFGELAANINGLLGTSTTTSFSIEPDTAPEFYVTGQPGPDTPAVRSLEHDVASLTANNPYSGNTHERIVNYMADPAEEAILHMVNADPARTPTFSVFAKPDYYIETGPSTCTPGTSLLPTTTSTDCVQQDDSYAWDHGDYAAEIDTNWAGFVGPGVAKLGLDGNQPNDFPGSAGINSGQVTVPQSGTTGTWVDETDIRPTLMHLTGLKDDYIEDGRVITELLAQPADNGLSSPATTALAVCYKQLNSSVGELGTATLEASTHAIESNSPGDTSYTEMDSDLVALDNARDHLAGQIKDELWRAEFANDSLNPGLETQQTAACWGIIGYADHLAIAGPSPLDQLPPIVSTWQTPQT